MTDARLPPSLRRAAMEALGRDCLAALTETFNLAVEDRRAHAAHVDAIVRSRSLDFREVLAHLSRDELKAICVALGLDPSGKEKQDIIKRITKGGGRVANEGKAGTNFALTVSQAKMKKARAAPAAKSSAAEPTGDYRHDAKRKNNPPAGLVDLDKPPPRPTARYEYDPHLDPTLAWSGKKEHSSFEVDTVSLHIHERISAQAIMRAVEREDAQRDLFGGDDLPESKAIDFYSHEVGWSNRLVLGDSLLVMNSLLEREQMAGKVQFIYVDPPYGVKFNSNFQPVISRRDVKDGDDGSLTREPEQIQAYRDTWTLGVHSYLTYLRDRLLLAREILAETGSIFVQISDENVHHVRELMEEVFGAENFISLIPFRKKTMPLGSVFMEQMSDFLVWFGKDKEKTKYHQLYVTQSVQGDAHYKTAQLPNGTIIDLTKEQVANHAQLPPGARPLQKKSLDPSGPMASGRFDFTFKGKTYPPPSSKGYCTTPEGMERLAAADRLIVEGDRLTYKLFADDFPVSALTAPWDDTIGARDKMYVVQTARDVVQRCMLMTTDPGDLVMDPTCGSGTTAYVAEQWGRRWITCDTSRVALAIARQRILTARFPYFCLRSDRVKDGFVYTTVPHITLRSIAQNAKLDRCKTQKERELAIRENAEQEVLYDQPEEDKSRVRVSGPFTVEAIPVASMEDPSEQPVPQLEPDDRADDLARRCRGTAGFDAGGDYVAYMIDLLKRSGGVHFKNNRTLPLTTLRAVKTAREWLHAESDTGFEGDDPRKVAVSFGPRHAPVTPVQVLQAIQQTRGYDIVLFVGFACDPEALRIIEAGTSDRILQFVHAAPDILVGDLLKTKKATKLFTVFGLPDVRVKKVAGGEVTVMLTGVDIYDPVTGETKHEEGENVAAWFLDQDYDGRCFCVSQAFFPARKGKGAWERLQKALKGAIDEERFEALGGTASISFKPGKSRKAAVKVIDDRGNEVVKVVSV